MMKRVFIVTPAGRGSRSGNRNTATRWATLLRSGGVSVRVGTEWRGEPIDVLVALHARRSHESIIRYRQAAPHGALVLALTGTDLYRDIRTDDNARRSMQFADRMIVLQEQGLDELDAPLRAKTRVIYQSARPLTRKPPLKSCFEIVIAGHLRDEKDPFRCALAAAHLPRESRIRIVHMGRAMSDDFEAEAKRLMAVQPRYRWIGEVSHAIVRRHLARARAMVLSSRMEGGANVASEAIAADLPVIASDISGNLGMLGTDYAGFYPLEDDRALAMLLTRFETDAGFRQQLAAQCAARKPLITVAAERAGLLALLSELSQ